MGDRLYGRSCQLIISAPDGQGRSFSGITPAALTSINIVDGQATISPKKDAQDVFRIAFNIELTSEGNANVGTISIYNLNETSRALIETDKVKMTLMAGYGPKPPVIFTGEVDGDRTKSEKNGPDIISTLESGDGRFSLKNVVINKTFAPGISLERVLEDVRKQMDIPGDFKGIQSEKFIQGLSLSGSPKEILDKLTQKQDLEWSIQNGVLEIKKKGNSIIEERVDISKETGLISIPKKTNEGVEFTTLLNPQLRPGRPIKLTSSFLKGDSFFIVRKVQHQGDNFQGPWNTFIEAGNPKDIKVFK